MASKGTIVIEDRKMRELWKKLTLMTDPSKPVQIEGESGVGKELVAGELHASSKRTGRFVTVNCAAIPKHLAESELFGHEPGAFTDGRRLHRGYFEQADGGTIFLDEIGELPLELQPKLLRVLEKRCITRVGGAEAVTVDVLVVCATNRDLQREVAAGTFRQDLYYRIRGRVVFVPPLRERLRDISALVETFVADEAAAASITPPRVSAPAMDLLLRYHWPGNVRELSSVITEVIDQRPVEVMPSHLPQQMRESIASDQRAAPRRSPSAVHRLIDDVISCVESSVEPPGPPQRGIIPKALDATLSELDPWELGVIRRSQPYIIKALTSRMPVVKPRAIRMAVKRAIERRSAGAPPPQTTPPTSFPGPGRDTFNERYKGVLLEHCTAATGGALNINCFADTGMGVAPFLTWLAADAEVLAHPDVGASAVSCRIVVTKPDILQSTFDTLGRFSQRLRGLPVQLWVKQYAGPAALHGNTITVLTHEWNKTTLHRLETEALLAPDDGDVRDMFIAGTMPPGQRPSAYDYERHFPGNTLFDGWLRKFNAWFSHAWTGPGQLFRLLEPEQIFPTR